MNTYLYAVACLVHLVPASQSSTLKSKKLAYPTLTITKWNAPARDPVSLPTPTSLLKDRLAGARAHGHAGIPSIPTNLKRRGALAFDSVHGRLLLHHSLDPRRDNLRSIYLPPHSPPGTEARLL